MQRSFITSLTLGSALILTACGPSAEEVQEQKEAEFRGSFITSCLGSIADTAETPEIAGNICNCGASKVVTELGLPESPGQQYPQAEMDRILNQCVAEASAPTPG